MIYCPWANIASGNAWLFLGLGNFLLLFHFPARFLSRLSCSAVHLRFLIINFSLELKLLIYVWMIVNFASRATKGDCVLDLCCGSGDLAFLLSEKVGIDGKVYCLPFPFPILSKPSKPPPLPQSAMDAPRIQRTCSSKPPNLFCKPYVFVITNLLGTMSSKKFVASEVDGVNPGVLDPSLFNEIEGWISKIVDPAYRLIAGGATRLLPSIFSSSISHSSTSTLPHTVPPSNVANHGFCWWPMMSSEFWQTFLTEDVMSDEQAMSFRMYR
ncbi:hypothetical protein Nepgr_025084 [Nepenthes gracilis]|uniref:Uncharacterized protein n=1 Tax=Nepenthes gracilis TaxID=150966 RepID=A0AAD3T743_NEPGR|nr:hypothetical protein Nepgr_025084 [Nepenthes gracilis]